MCTFTKMKTILSFILCGFMITFSEALENNVSLLEGKIVKGNDLNVGFVNPKILFGIEINNEHLCNGIVYVENTGITTAKCALKIRQALNNNENVKIWYGGHLGHHDSSTTIFEANKYDNHYDQLVEEIPEFYNRYLTIDLGLISLEVPFESDKVENAPIMDCLIVNAKEELLVMSRDSSENKECASSSSVASSSTMPAEYSKPIKTLTVIRISNTECRKIADLPLDALGYLRNFMCIYPKDKKARLEPTDIGSPVIEIEYGRLVVGIVCHTFDDGLLALVAPFKDIILSDGKFRLGRPRRMPNKSR